MKKIAILGTGNVAQTLAARLISQKYDVALGTRDAQAKLAASGPKGEEFAAWRKSNNAVKLESFEDAAKFGDLVINALQGGVSLEVLRKISGPLRGKVLIDLSNPLDFSKGMPPSLLPELSNTNSLGEEIQRALPETKVVKTLNTMWCGIMANPKMIGNGDHVNYICGNDKEAKAEAIAVLEAFGWDKKNILDLGDISNARGTEAVLPIWLRVWNATQNGAFNFKIVS